MADVIAATFDGPDEAEATLRTIRSLERRTRSSRATRPSSARTPTGRSPSTTRRAAVPRPGPSWAPCSVGCCSWSSRWRGSRGEPPLGGLIGRAAAPGIDGKWVKQVGDDLPAGGSALFLQIRGGEAGLVVSGIRQHKGRVFQTTLPDESSVDRPLHT